MGLEPTRPYEHRHLKPACLPIPARSHIILLRTLEHYTIRFSFVKREKREFLLPITFWTDLGLFNKPFVAMLEF